MNKHIALLLGGAALLAAVTLALTAGGAARALEPSPVAQTFGQIVYAGGDVVANQPHAFDAVDTALGGFVGVPVLELRPGDRLDVGLASEGHHDVDVANEFGVEGLWHLVR